MHLHLLNIWIWTWIWMPDLWLSAVFCPIKKIKVTPPYSRGVNVLHNVLMASMSLQRFLHMHIFSRN